MGKMTSEQASLKKRLGHAEESTFNVIFGDKTQETMNFNGASEDCLVTNSNYQKMIQEKLGPIKSFTVSLKSGVTWQFHMGPIPELTSKELRSVEKNSKGQTVINHGIDFKKQTLQLKSQTFWKKYLAKANLLCYNNQEGVYTFFKMEDIVNLIINKTSWKLLATGRIKGSLGLKNKIYNVLTYEYNSKLNRFSIGALSSRNGLRFYNILLENINHCSIDIKNKLNIVQEINIKKMNIKSNSVGKVGNMAFDENYFYICVGLNKWKRIKLETIK